MRVVVLAYLGNVSERELEFCCRYVIGKWGSVVVRLCEVFRFISESNGDVLFSVSAADTDLDTAAEP